MTVGTKQPSDSIPAQNAGHSTTDYSATKAPENRPAVESKVPAYDHRARPGGAHGSPGHLGIEGLGLETVSRRDRF